MTNETQIAQEAGRTETSANNQSLAFLCHEIRNPLTSMMATVEMLHASATPAQRELLAQAQFAGDHILALLNSVLDVGRLANGTLELNEGEFDVCDTVTGAMRMISNAKKQKLELQAGSGVPPTFSGDALRFKQVIVNLVSNAVKFTPEGGNITVHVTTEGTQLRITIEDSGIGMDERTMARLFQPYSQADGISKTHGGTGLGLYLSRRLVELMGGSLEVKSELGKGSTFTMLLPIRGNTQTCVANVPVAIRGTMGGVVSADQEGSKKRLVLIVEDESTIANLAEAVLNAAGNQCSIACTAVAALELAGSAPFDVILLDAGLDTVDGIELCSRLLEIQSRFAGHVAKVLGTSGYDCQSEFTAAGASAFLIKPFSLKDLASVVANL